jgi:type I restriction enzyme S subunit
MATNQLQKNIVQTPKLRFAGFNDAWSKNRLAKIASFAKGKGISKEDAVEDGKYKCIRYGELYTQYKEIIEEVYSKTNVPPLNSTLKRNNPVIL